jgi:uncharacterized protein YjbI with pentapeptide repeats
MVAHVTKSPMRTPKINCQPLHTFCSKPQNDDPFLSSTKQLGIPVVFCSTARPSLADVTITLCYASLRFVTLCYALLRFVTLCYALLRFVTLRYALLRFVTLVYALLRFVTLRYALLGFVTLCYATDDDDDDDFIKY